MALADPQRNCSMRPSNKEMPWASQYDDLFDQYVDASTFDFCTAASTISSSGDAGAFLGAPASPTREFPIASKSPHATEVTSFTNLCRTPETSLFDDAFLSRTSSPQSTVSSPGSSESPSVRRNSHKLSKTLSIDQLRPSSAGVRKTHRRLHTSPNMAQTMLSPCVPQDIWAQRLAATAEKYNIPYIYQSGPLSPPPSVKLTQWDDNSFTSPQFESPSSFQRSFSSHNQASHSSPVFSNHMPSQFTPLASPTNDHQPDQTTYFQHTTSTLNTPYFSNDPFTSDLIGSYTGSAKDHEMSCQDLSSDFQFGTSPQFNTHTVQPWWTSPDVDQAGERSTYQHARQLSQAIHSTLAGESYFANNVSPDNSLASQGLMIECSPARSVANTPRNLPQTSSVYEHKTFVTAPTTPKRSHRRPSLDSPSTSPSSSQPRSRRASRGQRRAKPANNGSPKAAIGFVNFTPDERDQILTGVAPSGSSKTKARREKEAADKRRRLSQAAAKAVMEAGGDLTALQKEGLFD